ncbi:MAG TPA: flagellar biosynthesis protein FlhF [Pantanalinema sp.]
MKIRQYTAATMQEARLKIKMDLGPDAVILHTRSFKRGGVFGLFAKEMVEVLAAVDAPDPGGYRLSPPLPSPTGHTPTLVSTIAPALPVTGPSEPPPPSTEVAELKEAVVEVKRMLGSMAEQLGTGRVEWPAPFAAFYNRLVASELAPELARALVTKLVESGAAEPTPEAVRAQESLIASWLSCSGAIAPPESLEARPKIVALVGPTGVGKTTTIAKLAANFRLIQQQDVVLITIDTYRVAAVEQLRTYGDIIGIPVEVVVTPSALKDAIARYSDKDVILIDTAGRSPSNRMHLHELRGFLDIPQPREVHLVLSATTNRANLERITEAFEPVGVDRVIFTKIDETGAFGAMLSAAHTFAKPLSYLTTGQSVPDDIRTADAAAMARMLTDEMLV